MTLTLFKLVHSFSNALVFGYMLLSKMAAEIKEQMTGKWKIYHRENMDAILEASGLNAAEKKLVKTAKPKVKIWVEDDDTIVNKFKSGPVLSDTTKFKLGEEYEKTYMGRTGRGTATWSDGKMKIHIIPKDPKFKDIFVEREIINGEMVQTMTVNGVVGKTFYKKVIKEDKKDKKDKKEKKDKKDKDKTDTSE